MKIKLVSCSNSQYWYRDLIGKEFTGAEISTTGTDYVVPERYRRNKKTNKLRHGGYIFIGDCKLLEDKP